jgi:hypothetical protein
VADWKIDGSHGRAMIDYSCETPFLPSTRPVSRGRVVQLGATNRWEPSLLAGGAVTVLILFTSTNKSFPCASVQILERVPFASPLPILAMLATAGRVRETTLIRT